LSVRWQNICIDSTDPAPLARFWANVLGWRITYEEDDEIVLEPPLGSAQEGLSPDILVLRVPESKSVKNRLHIDLRPDDRDAEVARIEGLGGKRIDIGQGPGVSWVVMADPQGNEFCVLRALTQEELAGS
jgi:predicted enzyme related to lactoylglutathione lyase